MNARVGAVVALPAEARCLAGRRCRPGELCDTRGLLLQVAGVGAGRARRAAETLLAAGAGSLLSFGVAAGLVRDLPPGVLLMPEVVVDVDGRRLSTDGAWRRRWSLRAAGLPRRQEALAEAPAVLADSAAKRALAARTGAIAADMESAAVVALAADAAVPALVVRCVVDPLEQRLPRAALAALREDGTTDPGALLLALLRRPGDLRGLARLAAGNRLALATLAEFADLVLDEEQPPDTDDSAAVAGQDPRPMIRQHADRRP